MEQIVECKSLTAIFQDDKLVLGGPHIIEFDTIGDRNFHVKIEQCRIRKIMVTSDKDVSALELYTVSTNIERLLMLFDGFFIPLAEVRLSQSDKIKESILRSYETDLIKVRLSYFSSSDFCRYKVNKLIDFVAILTAELFYKWEQLLDELNVVHQMYLYSLSDSKITVDVKCAFLIELAEPLIEIVKEHTDFFSSLTPGDRGTSLKNCLGALITKYGVDIFNSELSSDYERILQTMVNSRVKIMHIKRKQRGVYFDGAESVLYIFKMNLLYRKIMFEMLDIEETNYKDSLLRCVSSLDEWNSILDKFLLKFSIV